MNLLSNLLGSSRRIHIHNTSKESSPKSLLPACYTFQNRHYLCSVSLFPDALTEANPTQQQGLQGFVDHVAENQKRQQGLSSKKQNPMDPTTFSEGIEPSKNTPNYLLRRYGWIPRENKSKKGALRKSQAPPLKTNKSSRLPKVLGFQGGDGGHEAGGLPTT